MKLRYLGESFYNGFGLTKNKIYKCIGIEDEFFRIIDDEGEDYLYPISDELWEIIEDEENKLAFAIRDYKFTKN